MEDLRQPNEPPPTVQDEGQIQPIKPSNVTVSTEEYQRLLSYEVADQAIQHVKKRIWWPIIGVSLILGLFGWVGYKSLDPFVRQAMQPYMDNARDQLSDLKAAAGIAKDAAEAARTATRKATERADDLQESINKLKSQAQGVQISFETLNQKIDSTQSISVVVSSRDIEDVRNNIQRLEDLVTNIGKQDEQNRKMLADYKKATDEQRKNAEEYRAKVVENSAFTVAISYRFYNITTVHRNIAIALGREGFLYIFIPYQEQSDISTSSSISTTGIQLRTLTLQTPKITYYDSKYEPKAREVQRLIKSLVNIDTVEPASAASYRPFGLISIPSIGWQIEISF